MIPYVEVIGKYNLMPFAVVEPSDCWFEISYSNMGEFEVYAPATPNNINALKKGNYVVIPNKPYIWVIKSTDYSFNSEGAAMIDVKGYEAKWILNQRINPNPYDLESSLSIAIYNLVANNAGQSASATRKINKFIAIYSMLKDAQGNAITISQTQATRGNLWEIVQALLKANNCGCYTTYEDGKICFRAFSGTDKTEDMIFSQSLDNLITSEYFENSENYKNVCQVVSTFTENNQTTDYVGWSDNGSKGIDRYEMMIQNNISTKYVDSQGVEHTTTPSSNPNTLYGSWLVEAGKNALSEKIIIKEFNAQIDLTNSQYKFAKDYFIGDIVMVRDEYFDYEQPARIIKYTFKQDASGYGEEAEYGNGNE